MQLEARSRIGSPAAKVFSTISDVEHWPQIICSVESVRLLTERPISQGTRLRETRVIFGQLRNHEMAIVEFEEPRRLRLLVEDPDIDYQLDHIIDAVFELGSELTLRFKSRPMSLAERAAHPFMRPSMLPILQRELERDLADLLAAVRARR
jgi:hypothetical protein